ncbi:hypothetical protein lacNasYZ03_12890 [Lactobacillus nasalidis]|uniref:Uncharacterized protein n=1 Tax=Lactobacillus nasalidis TaxID=2797258 RepID=A0ABQ3W7J5_9LACO|nr:hypothetical protein lacNasYZ03_12890 [Lactobacillus nasalidis]
MLIDKLFGTMIMPQKFTFLENNKYSINTWNYSSVSNGTQVEIIQAG